VTEKLDAIIDYFRRFRDAARNEGELKIWLYVDRLVRGLEALGPEGRARMEKWLNDHDQHAPPYRETGAKHASIRWL
jgi:hypothetical protein